MVLPDSDDGVALGTLPRALIAALSVDGSARPPQGDPLSSSCMPILSSCEWPSGFAPSDTPSDAAGARRGRDRFEDCFLAIFLRFAREARSNLEVVVILLLHRARTLLALWRNLIAGELSPPVAPSGTSPSSLFPEGFEPKMKRSLDAFIFVSRNCAPFLYLAGKLASWAAILASSEL